MAEVILMPRLSDTMTEGVIAAWHKKVGDTVKKGDLLAEIETDKATMELESYQQGVLLHIGTPRGGKLQVNDLLAIIGTAGEDVSALVAQNTNTGSETKAAPENVKVETPAAPIAVSSDNIDFSKMDEVVLMPRLSDTMTEGVIAGWQKKVGDAVKKGEILADIETDKATMELESYKDGILLYQGANAGEKILVNQLLCIIGQPGLDIDAIVKSVKSASDSPAASAPVAQESKAIATPASTAATVVAAPVAPAASVVNEGRIFKADILIEDGKIKEIFENSADFKDQNIEVISAEGKYILPGLIDDQVHFREPGLTHKGNIASESKAAAAGGVTSFMEMPNTNPQTTTAQELEKKFAIAAESSAVNYSFFMGATNHNIDELLAVDVRHTAGIKIFMGSSTGDMLVDDTHVLCEIFKKSKVLIATHCEDEQTIKNNLETYKAKYGEEIPFSAHPLIRNEEACYKSSSMAVQLAKKHDTRLHILHISSASEV